MTFDRQTLYYLFLLFGLVWSAGLAYNLYNSMVLSRRGVFHPIVQLFTATIVMFVAALWLQWVHRAVYAGNGIGVPAIDLLGKAFDMLSDVVFMVLLLLLAQGWAVSQQQIEHRLPVLGSAAALIVFDVILMLCMEYAINPAKNVFMYVTVPGIMLLLVRGAALLAFIVLVVRSIKNEPNADKRRFYVLLGSVFSLYFVSLPVIALLSATFPITYSYKIVMWLYTFSKTAAFAVMLVLLSPDKAETYFALSQPSLLGQHAGKASATYGANAL